MRPVLLLFAAFGFAACDQAEDPEAMPADSVVATDNAAVDATSDTGPAVTIDPVVSRWLARVDSSVFTRWGACPFECCVYRDWVAEQQVIVRAAPDSSATVVATIPAGDRFEADTGFVRVTSAQLVVVSDTVEAYRVTGRADGGQPDSLAPGDTVLVLDYAGEGHYMVTDGRVVYSALQFWPGPDGWEPYDGARGSAIGSHAAEWWAQVRLADGTAGWIDAYASELGNVDACGMPG